MDQDRVSLKPVHGRIQCYGIQVNEGQVRSLRVSRTNYQPNKKIVCIKKERIGGLGGHVTLTGLGPGPDPDEPDLGRVFAASEHSCMSFLFFYILNY